MEAPVPLRFGGQPFLPVCELEAAYLMLLSRIAGIREDRAQFA